MGKYALDDFGAENAKGGRAGEESTREKGACDWVDNGCCTVPLPV